jgi:hypothetical protein
MISLAITFYMLLSANAPAGFIERWPQREFEFGPLVFDYLRVHEVVKGPECMWMACEIS